MSFARLLQHTHLALVVFWAANLVVAVLVFVFLPPLWQKIAVLYLVIVSIYANLATHWSGWQGSRTEVKVEGTEQVTGGDVTVQNAGRVGGPRS